jgi:hypothetical protein
MPARAPLPLLQRKFAICHPKLDKPARSVPAAYLGLLGSSFTATLVPTANATEIAIFNFEDSTNAGPPDFTSEVDYYDYFAERHYELNPERERLQSIAASDRMLALQTELNYRRTRDLQVGTAVLAAIVLIGIAFCQRPANKPTANPASSSANTAR